MQEDQATTRVRTTTLPPGYQIRKLGRELRHLRDIREILKTLTPDDVGAANLASLAETVRRLDRESSDTIPYTRTAFNIGCLLFTGLIFGAIFVFAKDEDQKQKYDLIAYILPMFAGYLAGFGFFVRARANQAFICSIGVLMLGFGFYLRANKHFSASLCDASGFLLMLGILGFVIFPSVRDRQLKKKKVIGAIDGALTECFWQSEVF